MTSQNDSPAFDNTRLQASAFANIASVLLSAPSRQTIEELFRLTHSLGIHPSDSPSDSALEPKQLDEAFFNRTVVATSPLFVPLYEQAIRSAHKTDAGWAYSLASNRYTREVERFYCAAGFNPQRLGMAQDAPINMRSDSLAAELAFVAFLLDDTIRIEAELTPEDRRQMARDFLNAHPKSWVRKAAEIAASSAEDWYATAIFLAAELVENA